VKNLRAEAMPSLLRAGWALESAVAPESSVSAEEIAGVHADLYRVDLTSVFDAYIELVFKVRDLGIAFSDRRAVKVQKLLAASALLCGRMSCNSSDLWVMRYVWDREEQIEPLAAIVNGVLHQHGAEGDSHPLASVQAVPDAEDLARQLDAAEAQVRDNGRLTLSAAARLRQHLADLADRAAWLPDFDARTHLMERARQCLEKLG
jgi:MoxR-like ATPase